MVFSDYVGKLTFKKVLWKVLQKEIYVRNFAFIAETKASVILRWLYEY